MYEMHVGSEVHLTTAIWVELTERRQGHLLECMIGLGVPNDKFRQIYIRVRLREVRPRFSASIKECLTWIFVTEVWPKR